MSITTNIDLMSNGLRQKAIDEKWWNGKSTFDWKQVMGEASKLPSTKLATPEERYSSGKKLLHDLSIKGNFDLELGRECY